MPAKGLRSKAFFDVDYSDWSAIRSALVRRLYGRLGNELSSDVELRMRAFLESNSPARHGRHSYSLAAFGMNPVNLSERFSSYRTRFSRLSSDPKPEPSGPRDRVSTADPRSLFSEGRQMIHANPS